jgi:nucleotide-binding universal stress UspA family protein
VLALYRRSVAGDQALRDAYELARDAGARLTILAVALQERADSRCCSIRSGYWNCVLRDLAVDDLEMATHVLDGADAVEFATAAGSSVDSVVAREAGERGCDLVVLPRRPHRWSYTRECGARRKLQRRLNCAVVELPH